MKLLEKIKVPLDVILIVVGPFVGFLVLFMYLAGLIPAQPIVVEIPDNAVVRNPGGETGNAVPETGKIPSQPATVPQPVATAAGTETAETEPPEATLKETVEQVPPDVADKPLIVKNPIDEERAKRVKQIAKVYDQMNAGSVAAIIKSMDDDDAVEILSMMNPRNAARVLAALDPDKAARLSLMLAE
jgi:hypothetical protein